MIRSLVKQFLPGPILRRLNKIRQERRRASIARQPLITETLFVEIVTNRLGLVRGDTVIIHSSVDNLNLGFPFFKILPVLQNIVGPNGTIIFPTFPRLSSYDTLKSGEVFDVRRSPSYTGVLSEFARRQKSSLRSLSPTKSVCAIGAHASDLTSTHHASPFTFDTCSPFFRIMEFDGKIIGLGVSTRPLSFVHCVEDFLKSEFPMKPYHEQLFHASCIDYSGIEVVVPTYGHDIKKMKHDIPRFMRTHVSPDICADFSIGGTPFFRAKSKPLFESMMDLARKGITIYPI